ADVYQPVTGDLHTMNRIAERRRRRCGWVVSRELRGVVVRPLAVGAPVTLVGARLRVEHDDAMIAVAVRHVDFALVNPHVRLPPALGLIVVALSRASLADLHDEFSFGRELEDHAVLRRIAAEPDEAVRIEPNAVLVRRPLVIRARSAPGLQHRA